MLTDNQDKKREREQAEKALKESERFLRSTLDGLSAHIAVIDERGEIILTNKAYRDFGERNGVEPGALFEGTNYLAVCDTATGECSEEATPFAAGIREVLSGKRPYFELEYPCHSPDEKRWFIGRVTPINGEGPRRVIVSHENITEWKRAEARRQEGFDLLNNLACLVPGVIYQYRLYPDGRSAFPYSSPGMYDIYEVTPEEVREDASAVFGRLHPEDHDRVAAAIFESARTLNTFHCEFRVILPKQGLRWRRSHAYPERTEDGGTLWYGIVLDITERKQAEEALRKSEERFLLAMKASHDGLFDWNLETNEIYYSPGWKKILGYEDHELPNDFSVWENTTEPEDVKKSWELQQQLITKQIDRFVLEFKMKHKAGHWVDILSRAEAIFNDSGQAVRIVGTHTDITARKRAEAQVKLSEKNLRNIADTMQETLSVIALDGTFLYANQKAARNMSGRKTADIIGKNIRELIPKDQAESLIETYQSVYRSGEPFHQEIEVGLKKANTWFFNTLKPIEYGSPPMPAVLSVSLDITERKRTEAALLASETRYKSAEKVGHIGNWEYDLTTGLFWGSDEAKRIYGFDPNQDVFSVETVETCIPERERVHQALLDLIEKGTEYNLEFQIFPVNSKQPKTIASVAEVRKDEKGMPVSVVGVIQDITERKQAEAEREKLASQLTQSQKMESVGQLAGGIAHDFNNILVPIIGYAELGMIDLLPNDKLYANLQHIYRAAERATALTRQILAFSRKQVLEMKSLNLNKVVTDFEKMLRRLIGENIIVKAVLSPALALVQADPAQIEQILMNLAINARDAMPQGGRLTIETDNLFLDKSYAHTHIEVEPGPYVMLAVSDTGIGMDAETQKHIFEPFFTTKPQGAGTGLGLATVFGIVKQHQGYIWVYSEPGQGTTFKVYLPQADRAEPDIATSAPPDSLYGTEIILLVEDEAMVRKLACETLTAYGYTVLEAQSPAAALRLAADYQDTINLLLTDVIMPEMNGRQLYQKVAAIRPEISVLYMSGYTDNVIVHHGVLHQDVNFLQKPFTVHRLTQKVKEALR